jgi:hypothetical protein
VPPKRFATGLPSGWQGWVWAQALFHKLPSGPNNRLVEIGEGTHFVMLEKNRIQLFQEVQIFLDRARRN